MVSGSARSIRNRGVKINNDCNPTTGSTVVTSDIDELSTELAATKAERTTHPPGGDRGRRERVQEQLQLRAAPRAQLQLQGWRGKTAGGSSRPKATALKGYRDPGSGRMYYSNSVSTLLTRSEDLGLQS